VISNCVINLSPEKQRVFAEIARVLRPGGRMLVSDIVAKDLPAWVRQSEAMLSSCVAGAIDEEAYVAGLRRAGLVDVEVRARHVYDADQIDAFFGADSAAAELAGGCCGGAAVVKPLLRRAASSLEGKVWSAKIFARKPG
jgi:SAM-dependent methyltransferase